MTVAATDTIRSLFATRRPIDRPIEKVIDYYAADERRLQAEIEEYEVTASVEQNFRRFLDVYGEGVRGGRVAETGIWVSGFYGSGKSSFTKYLGFALDPQRTVGGRPFLDLLAERIPARDVAQELRTLARQEPAAVIMLDLGAEQLASSAVATVASVLYWKVLQWAGYAKEQKTARLELRLDHDGRLGEWHRAYAVRFGGAWEDVHDDPLVGVARADGLLPAFYPQEFPGPGAFRGLRFAMAESARDLAGEMLELVRRKSGCRNVLFLVDEAGQYVAPRGELILNLDGLARNLKELGEGRVWLVATGQQTLTEIVQKAAYNSAELNKLRDRFPIAIQLDAADIREITWRRLLTKSAAGEATLRELYRRHGQALVTNTRLAGSTLYGGAVDEETFVRLYPFLPQHFALLLELVRALARSTGGLGLRSAIRMIQDLLVDTSKVLPAGATMLADQSVGRLATVDDFFDTLRADLARELPHVVSGVERTATVLPGDALALRAAKAIAALQPVETFPRSAENLAALLYRQVGDAPHLDDVREALGRLLAEKDTGVVEDPQAGGYAFLSEGVKPLRDRRNAYMPTSGEINQLRSRVLKALFDPSPVAALEGAKTVKAGVKLGNVPLVGDDDEIQFRLEATDDAGWEHRRTTLLTDTTGRPEWRTAIAWLLRPEEGVDDVLAEAVRSQRVVRDTLEHEADKDVAQFLNAERRAAQRYEDQAQASYRAALLAGTLIFRGNPIPARTAGADVASVARTVLQGAAAEVYPYFHLVNVRPATDLAAKFLGVERLDRMSRDFDPLGFVAVGGGHTRVRADHAALAQALQAFRERLDQSGTDRLQGNALQDLFAAAPYGWSKDATRYVFAALLLAGEVVFHTAAGVVQVPSPAAVEAVRTTQSFGKVGVGLRGGKPSLEMLDRASDRLQQITGALVLPTEDSISRAAREHLPSLLEPLAGLPRELELLALAGAGRAQALAETGRALLQGDGSAALSVLGATDCTLPADLQWARQAAAALANGAPEAIRAARRLVADADALAGDFPEVHLLADDDRALVDDVLRSETFYERLPDLRGVLRRVYRRAADCYAERRAAYQAGLMQVKEELEALPEWMRIGDDDRAAIGARLALDLPAAPEEGQEIAALRRLLVRQTGLAGLRGELEREVFQRLPPPQLRNGAAEDAEPVEFDLARVPAPVIRDPGDLEPWFDEVRAAVANALLSGAPVRLRVRR